MNPTTSTNADLDHPLLDSLREQFGPGVRQAVVFQRRDADAARHVMRSAGLGAGLLMRSLGKRRAGGLPNMGILALVDGELRAFSTKGGGAGMRAKELAYSWLPAELTAEVETGRDNDVVTLRRGDQAWSFEVYAAYRPYREDLLEAAGIAGA